MLKNNGFAALTYEPPVSPRFFVDGERLRRALDAGSIRPAFQPIVRIPNGSIASFEVLARWYDDELGAVPPSLFVPVAESAGLMEELTTHLVQTACASAAEWNGKFRLAFNISPLQFQRPEAAAQIEEAARPSGFPLSRIQVEITESAVIDDLESARASVRRLKALGVQIVLDDFGTGFSSLTRLQALPFDIIKIEASFVQSMGASRDSRKIVSAVIGLGQSLGMPVVAEGVETAAQLRMLSELGCDFGQGFLFSRPDSAEAIPPLLQLRGEQAANPSPLNFSCNLKLAQLRAIYAGAPFALCFVDLDRRYVSANRRFAEMIGVDLEEMTGRRVDEVYPEALAYVLADIEAVVTGRRAPQRECVTPAGRIVMSTVAAARDENNEVVGMSVALFDITKFKRPTSSWLARVKPLFKGRVRRAVNGFGGDKL